MNNLNIFLIRSTALLGSSTPEEIQQLTNTITTAMTAVMGVLYGIGAILITYRLISAIVFSKNADNPEDEVAMYKKRIKNSIIALIIITVAEVGFTTLTQTVLKGWISGLFN